MATAIVSQTTTCSRSQPRTLTILIPHNVEEWRTTLPLPDYVRVADLPGVVLQYEQQANAMEISSSFHCHKM